MNRETGTNVLTCSFGAFKVLDRPLNLQEKGAVPQEERQVLTADKGYDGLSTVTVEPIPNGFADVTGVTAAPEHVLAGKRFVDAAGAAKEGVMADNGAVALLLDGLIEPAATIPAGYHNGQGKVTLTGDLEAALTAI